MDFGNYTQAIILKTFTNRATLLSQQHGKIIVGTTRANNYLRLSPGMVVSGIIKEYRSGFYMQHATIEFFPLFDVAEDILFLHHLFELTHNFFPAGVVADHVYVFVNNLIINSRHFGLLKEYKPVFFKACIGGLLVFTGSYYPPQEYEKALIGVRQIIMTTVDISWERTIDSLQAYLCDLMNNADICSLDRWLTACIQSHPRAKFFKTGEVVYQLEKAPSDKV